MWFSSSTRNKLHVNPRAVSLFPTALTDQIHRPQLDSNFSKAIVAEQTTDFMTALTKNTRQNCAPDCKILLMQPNMPISRFEVALIDHNHISGDLSH